MEAAEAEVAVAIFSASNDKANTISIAKWLAKSKKSRENVTFSSHTQFADC